MTTTTNTVTATERARMTAIMDLPEAATNPRLAGHLAVATNMAPKDAQRTLQAAEGKGQFAHLNTPEAKASLAAWRERYTAKKAAADTAEKIASMTAAARAAGVAGPAKR